MNPPLKTKLVLIAIGIVSVALNAHAVTKYRRWRGEVLSAAQTLNHQTATNL